MAKNASTSDPLEAALAEDDVQIDSEVLNETVEGINARRRLLEHQISDMKNDLSRLTYEVKQEEERIKENQEKIKLNRVLPYLVGHVVEVCIDWAVHVLWVYVVVVVVVRLLLGDCMASIVAASRVRCRTIYNALSRISMLVVCS
jgi:ATP-dependent 26S proteasome regulatory subunit